MGKNVLPAFIRIDECRWKSSDIAFKFEINFNCIRNSRVYRIFIIRRDTDPLANGTKENGCCGTINKKKNVYFIK